MNLDVDNEQDVLCEKIINDIDIVFHKDTELSSFEIIPTILNENKSPVIHVEHHLGLESWCAKHVYNYAHKVVLTFKHHHQHHQRYMLQNEMLIKYLNVALLINPDVSTFWNIRRQLVQKNLLEINREFQIAGLILTKKPKSNEAFAYRRWLFSFQSSESIDWHNEIGICERSADRTSSNYHAWLHRQWVLQNAPSLLQSEIRLSEKFMRKHIGDYSCYQYRQAVLARAYETCFYDADSLTNLIDLRELITNYLITDVRNMEDILKILLPRVDRTAIDEKRLKCFLYCCNLAAHDMRLCNEQKKLYGDRESFENHRRASLKFIVEHCVRLLQGEIIGLYFEPQTPAKARAFNGRIRKFNYSSYDFLEALRRSENLISKTHRQWCSLFLGFNYEGA